MFLPSVHSESDASWRSCGCAVSVWSPSLPHSGLRPSLFCTATPLPPVCRGQTHSSTEPLHPPSPDTLLQTQKRCAAVLSLPLESRKTNRYVVKSVTMQIDRALWLTLVNTFLPWWFMNGQYCVLRSFPFHHTCMCNVFEVYFLIKCSKLLFFNGSCNLKKLPGSTSTVLQNSVEWQFLSCLWAAKMKGSYKDKLRQHLIIMSLLEEVNKNRLVLTDPCKKLSRHFIPEHLAHDFVLSDRGAVQLE